MGEREKSANGQGFGKLNMPIVIEKWYEMRPIQNDDHLFIDGAVIEYILKEFPIRQ
jgi:hypothetical protein